MSCQVRIVTWNVNGIRNPFKYSPWNKERTLQSMFDILEADIVCFQEVKTPKAGITDDLVTVNGWDTFYSFPHSQTGYSGVSVYTRDSKCIPLRVEEGVTGVLKVAGTQTRYVELPPEKQIGGYPTDKQLRRAAVGRDIIDSEGRCLILEFPLFVLINVYCPARRNQERTGYRNTFLLALDARIRNLAAVGKNVVLCGDLNIMRDQLDSAGIWGHQGQKVMAEALEFDETYMVMRAPKLLNQLFFNSRQISETGARFVDESVEKRRPPVLCDTGREMHPTRAGMFTCWDTRKNHRPANFGSRIDYIGCSPKIMQLVQEADIQPQFHGSDHCPVYIILREEVKDAGTGASTHTLDYLNPPGRYAGGRKALSDEADAALIKRFPQSGRRMPQFANRRHIASMFRPPSKPIATPEVVSLPSNHTAGTGAETISELPDIFKADIVELVESSDDDDDIGNIEDDDEIDPLGMAGDDDDEPSAQPSSTSRLPKGAPREERRSSTLSFHANKIPSFSSQSSQVSPLLPPNSPEKQVLGKISPKTDEMFLAGSEDSLINTPLEQGETPPDTDDRPNPTHREDGTKTFSNVLAWPPSAPKPKAASARRTLARARSSGGVPGASAAPSPSPSSTSERPTKKTKTTAGTQTSINMFLQTRDRPNDQRQGRQGQEKQRQEEVDVSTPGKSTVEDSPSKPGRSQGSDTALQVDAAGDPEKEEEAWMTAEEVDTAFKNLDAAKASWSRLGLGQHQAPLCEHDEPCKTFVTKKAGVNSGRSFYMCARPPGPLGKREKGTAWQCTTFVWCRDWKPDRKE